MRSAEQVVERPSCRLRHTARSRPAASWTASHIDEEHLIPRRSEASVPAQLGSAARIDAEKEGGRVISDDVAEACAQMVSDRTTPLLKNMSPA